MAMWHLWCGKKLRQEKNAEDLGMYLSEAPPFSADLCKESEISKFKPGLPSHQEGLSVKMGEQSIFFFQSIFIQQFVSQISNLLTIRHIWASVLFPWPKLSLLLEDHVEQLSGPNQTPLLIFRKSYQNAATPTHFRVACSCFHVTIAVQQSQVRQKPHASQS